MDKLRKQNILNISSYLKFIEFTLGSVSEKNADGDKTIKDIKNDFKRKFHFDLPYLLNQNFGILRLIPLLLIREYYKKSNISDSDRKSIDIIRHALAHGNFSIDEKGYNFWCDKGEINYSFIDFQHFINKIEHEFYDHHY
ncbi:hypothetical protein [Legionella qingyii]|uniref:hypothetical protein n=1 Tax=Legionella qingyii TaxID=2184757 RepID=UPI000F8D97AD|nr:hypothetical protein [Legionella qingyii]RUR24669.1 hypothetical protein ELY16_10830 [Legionella qingyii]